MEIKVGVIRGPQAGRLMCNQVKIKNTWFYLHHQLWMIRAAMLLLSKRKLF